jgi:[acyl-carrier-protein] S-malonyltransferase
MAINPAASTLVFPGQGSQVVGMGRKLATTFTVARTVFEEADSTLGFPLTKLMWEGPDGELNDTVNTQPSLFVHSIAAFRVLKSFYPTFVPAYVAGHSLGELTALVAASAITFSDGLKLVRTRGELMKEAGRINPGGMAAIMGVDIPTLEKICMRASTAYQLVTVANDNSPGQVVISGHKPALERALVLAKEAGARRTLPLPVSIAAHSRLMSGIQHDWDEAVNNVSCSDPKIPVIGNVTAGLLTKADALREDISAQMQSRVRWVDSVRFMTERGVTTFLEVGTGSVLGGLIKRISNDVMVLPLGNPQDFDALN